MLQIRLFFCFGAAVLELPFFDAMARSSFVFCNSVSPDRTLMAASRLVGAAAACVILSSFAAGPRKDYWSKVAIVICCTGDFRFTIPFEQCFKSVFFFALAPRSGFGAAISRTFVRKGLCVCVKASLCKSFCG